MNPLWAADVPVPVGLLRKSNAPEAMGSRRQLPTHRCVCLAVIVALFACLASPIVVVPVALAQRLDPAVRDQVVPAAVQIAIDVVWVEGGYRSPVPLPLGSGTVVSPDGLILTNAHVVERSGMARTVREFEAAAREFAPEVTLEFSSDHLLVLVSNGVRPPEPAFQARVETYDEPLDLAVLRIVAKATGGSLADGFSVPFVPLGDAEALGLGDPVYLFGYPASGGDALTYTQGVVSGFNFEDGIDGPVWVNTDAVMSGGSSGGTAINEFGELIGIPTQGARLDCRPGDTNQDGKITAEDVGCIPTGGSIGQLRPVNLAAALLPPGMRDVRQAAAVSEPTAAPMPTATSRPNPTPAPTAFGFVHEFEGTKVIVDEPDAYVGYIDGHFQVSILQPGLVRVPSWDGGTSPGRGVSWEAVVASTSGQGQVIVEVSSEVDDALWDFAIDPVSQTWALYRQSIYSGDLFAWVEPRSYRQYVSGPVETLEIRVVQGRPRLLINGSDVVTPLGIEMPTIAGDLDFGLGAGIDPRGCYGLWAMRLTNCRTIRQAKATKCSPATVSGSRS